MKRTRRTLNPAHVTVAILLLLAAFPARAGVKYKVLHNFGSGKDGATPYGPPAFYGEELYGVTISGGTGCNPPLCGTVFSLSPQPSGTWKEAIVYNFPGGDYSYPGDGLIFDSRGNLYGIMGGYKGGVYELAPRPAEWDFTPLYTGGAQGGLLMDQSGNLYGGMGPGQDHGGAIGELSPGSGGWDYTQLYSFCSGNSCPDGVDMPTAPIWDGKGNLFGTTTWGGVYKGFCRAYYGYDGCGVIYEMTPNGDGTWTYHVLHGFASSKNDGQNPYGGLVMDKAGNFYGGTWTGGRYELGTLFKLTYAAGHWQETILYDFTDCKQGCGADGTLALDKAGNLYGTAAGGTGSCDGLTCGVVFKLSPQKDGKWKYTVVYDFTDEGGGSAPFYGVILDDKGHLFGVTSKFGKYGFGTAFEITP
jgi:hypothetical protein